MVTFMNDTELEVELEKQFDAGITFHEFLMLDIFENESKFERFLKSPYSEHSGCDFLNRLQIAVKKIINRG